MEEEESLKKEMPSNLMNPQKMDSPVVVSQVITPRTDRIQETVAIKDYREKQSMSAVDFDVEKYRDIFPRHARRAHLSNSFARYKNAEELMKRSAEQARSNYQRHSNIWQKGLKHAEELRASDSKSRVIGESVLVTTVNKHRPKLHQNPSFIDS